MKYILILCDGMADYPVAQLGGKTPLQCAKKPNMDYLAKHGKVGMVKTVPEKFSPGSDVANLSVMGYDPELYYTGRSPIEAVSMGICLEETDVALRCNLVTLSSEENYSNKTIIDYCADEISTIEAHELISLIDDHFKTSEIRFYPGISYRHCMVWKNGSLNLGLTPPHDILDKNISSYLPSSKSLLDMMEKSYDLLKDHPVNKKRISKGLNPANSIWLWGEGKKPSVPKFYDKYKLNGSVISAVDLIKGLGICAGLKSIDVEGATGNIHTNFIGKAEAAIKELQSGQDFVYIHIEAPDECGHRNEIENKVKSIEIIDEKIIGTLLENLKSYDDYKILVVPDHATPLSLRTHTKDPVPFIIYQKKYHKDHKDYDTYGYDEFLAKNSGLFINDGHTLMDYFLSSNV